MPLHSPLPGFTQPLFAKLCEARAWLLHHWRARPPARRAAWSPSAALISPQRLLALAAQRQAAMGSHALAQPMSVLSIALDPLRPVGLDPDPVTLDLALHATAQALRRGLRQGDLLSRWKGGAFVAVLPSSDANAARMVAERLRALVQASLLRVGRDRVLLPLSICLGVGAVSSDEPLTEAIVRAEAALAAARRAGRNRVHAASA